MTSRDDIPEADMTLEEQLADDLEDLEDVQENSPVIQHQHRKFTPTQIKSYISILTSALGGVDHSSDIQPPPYKLGEEALLCLQDIKKWLKTYDDQGNSWEVAVACAEAGLVNDLVVILCLWEDSTTKKTTISGYSKDYDNKIARLCLQLLIVLTWPLQLTKGMYKEQLQHYSNLKKHQLVYKKLILSFGNGKALKAVIKIALPILAVTYWDRKPSDNGILRLCITLFRNLLAIEPAGITKITQKAAKQSSLNDNLPRGVNYEDISVGACISAFEHNLVFTFLLTIASTLEDERNNDDLPTLILDIIHYLTRSIRPQYVMSQSENIEQSTKSGSGLELGDLLSKEKEMKAKFQKNSSSRHGRFGTLLSLQTPDMGRLTVSGGGNLLTSKNSLKAFDSHKGWHKPQRFKYEADEEVTYPEITVGAANKKYFHSFVCDFIDGVFNPFASICNRYFQSDSGKSREKIQYLTFLSWFLEAQRLRNGKDVGSTDYALVGDVLSESAFRLIFKFLTDSAEKSTRDWGVAHAALIAVKELLYIVETMSASDDTDFQDLATDIKERLFHKTGYIDVISYYPKEAHKRAPEFVDTCVEVIDILFKTLESYAKEDMKKIILGKKNRQVKKNLTNEQVAIDNLSSLDDESVSMLASKLSEKRKSDFKKIQLKFANHGTINTYVVFLKRFQDLPDKSLKNAIKFFHRTFFEQKKHTLLYRLDFQYLLHSMLADDGLPKSSRIRHHVSQFLTHYMKKMKSSLDNTPSLYFEMLFPVISSKDVSYYLNTGEILEERKGKATTVSQIATIKNIETMDREAEVAIMVAALIDDDKKHLVEWLGDELERVVTLRMQQLNHDIAPSQQEIEQREVNVQPIAIHSDTEELQRALVTQAKIRYILKLAGFMLPDSTDDECLFGVHADQAKLVEVLNHVKTFLITPVPFADGKVANDFIEIKNIRAEYEKHNASLNNYESDDEYDDNRRYESGDEAEFDVDFDEPEPVSYRGDDLDELERNISQSEQSSTRGVARTKNKKPMSSNRSSKSGDGKSTGRRKKRNDLPMHQQSDNEVDGGGHRKKHEERTTHISSKYVVDSDDESDDEADQAFFERERLLRLLLNQNNGTLSKNQVNDFLSGKLKASDVIESENAASQEAQADREEPAIASKRRPTDELESPQSKRKLFIDQSESEDDSDEIPNNEVVGDQPSGDSDVDVSGVAPNGSQRETRVSASVRAPEQSDESDSDDADDDVSEIGIENDYSVDNEEEHVDEEQSETVHVRRKNKIIFDDEDDE